MGASPAARSAARCSTPGQRGPTFIGKARLRPAGPTDLRVRMTGSIYKSDKAMSSTLYGGDRAGSRYYYVMENTAATESAQFTSGLINPGFRNRVTAMQFNPFVKFRGLEFFGVVERAEGGAPRRRLTGTWNQYAADVVYRFMPREQVYAGLRYNKANGTLVGIAERSGRQPVAGRGRLVRDAERADEGRVRRRRNTTASRRRTSATAASSTA